MTKVSIDLNRVEYLEIMRQFLALDDTQKEVFKKWYNRFFLWCIGSIVFKYKRFRVGVCNFEFVECSVVRISKMGRLEKTWDDIDALIELKDSYLIKIKKGAMPQPKRFLSDEDQLLFKAYANKKFVIA